MWRSMLGMRSAQMNMDSLLESSTADTACLLAWTLLQ